MRKKSMTESYCLKKLKNYPNPFNPETKIKFGLPKSGNVRLTVYDVSGRKIEELVNQKLNAGIFEVI